MTIVENSYYDHEEHGSVRVLEVTDDIVAFELMETEMRFPGGVSFPEAKREQLATFEEQASPGDVSVDADYIVINSESRTPGR